MLHTACTLLPVDTFRSLYSSTDRPSDTTMGANGQSDAAANLTHTKFLFVLPYQDDAATLTKIRTAGSNISRGFFNDYDADGTRDAQPQETIQFLAADAHTAGPRGDRRRAFRCARVGELSPAAGRGRRAS